MQADKTTLTDLSIFNADETLSVFHRLDFTTTIGGRDWLRALLSKTYDNRKQIEEMQQLLQSLIPLLDSFPTIISNGTIMVIERFYETPLDEMPDHANTLNSVSYKVFHSADFSLTRYSVEHFINFVKGLDSIVQLYSNADSTILRNTTTRIASLMAKPVIREMVAWDKTQKLPYRLIVHFGNYMRRQFKQEALELVNIYSKMDAYCSMATACRRYNFGIPKFEESSQPFMIAEQLYHPLLNTPVAYDIQLTQQQNFLFMTGANMAGKSTFIKAIGVAVYLAHVGMGVPAQNMRLSLFDGLLSNIQVVDNIVQGESYFFNEVQRIRKTIQQISDGRKWLILIDELFKGTNVQDAMKCSTVVIEGLRKMHNALFVLSTHLYEIGQTLKQYDNIQFRYFETDVKNDQLIFSYHLKEGISNDRLGYLILKREGVVDLLNRIPDTSPEVGKSVQSS
jgi:DNA mismatch repair protein MutS